jgi:hypothetical protein
LAALVTCALIAGFSTTASADVGTGPELLQATIYPGPTTMTLNVGGMDSCQPLNPAFDSFGLYDGQRDTPVANASLQSGSSWTMATVLSCGLGIPPNDVTDVVVQRYRGSFENPLTEGELTDVSDYHDPDAPGALPAIGANGDFGGNNQYARPWMGGSDDNDADQVQDFGNPIAIQIYEGDPPLKVAITPTRSASSASTYSFTAAVTDASGTPIADSALSFAWDFHDTTNGSSSTPAPSHIFTGTGAYVVSVQATEAKTGDSGAGYASVTVGSSQPQVGATGQPGAGNTGPQGSSPTGREGSNGGTPNAGSGNQHQQDSGTPTGSGHNQHPATDRHHRTHHTEQAKSGTNASGGSTPDGGSSTGNGSGSPDGGSGANQTGNSSRSSAPAANPSAPTTTHNPPVAKPTATSPVVKGLLISDITPLSANASPLVSSGRPNRVTAPQVRRQIDASTVPGILGGVGVLVLFLIGAARERFWRRRVRNVRFGT